MTTRTVRRVYVEDTLDPKTRTIRGVRTFRPGVRVRDTLLNAIGTGKVLCLGTIWTGELKAYVDGYMSALEPIVSGFTLGRTLNAEGSDTLNLGRVWLGALGERIADALAASSGASAGSTVDLAPLATATSNLQEAIEQGVTARAADAFAAMKRARDALGREEREVQQALHHDGLAGINAGTREQIRSMQGAAEKMWRPTSSATTADATAETAVRDGLHAAATATCERSRLEALNGLNKRFWSARCARPTGDAEAAPARSTAPTSIAQMNAAAKVLWAGR